MLRQITGPIEGQETENKDILAARLGWQNGLTLSETYHRSVKRGKTIDKAILIAEWRKMKRIFKCHSLRHDYVNGQKYRVREYTQKELDAPISNIAGGLTYGEWKGITGPGKQLRDVLSTEQ